MDWDEGLRMVCSGVIKEPFVATNIAIRAYLFCVFAMTSAAVAQQPADNRAGGERKAPRAGVNGVGAPQCIHCPPPEYTEEARAVNYSGTILLEVTVTSDGKVIDPVVMKSPGLGLNEKALAQVKKWKMKPALGQDGKPVNCRVQIEVTFHRYNQPPLY